MEMQDYVTRYMNKVDSLIQAYLSGSNVTGTKVMFCICNCFHWVCKSMFAAIRSCPQCCWTLNSIPNASTVSKKFLGSAETSVLLHYGGWEVGEHQDPFLLVGDGL